jgi:hypothetical protein
MNPRPTLWTARSRGSSRIPDLTDEGRPAQARAHSVQPASRRVQRIPLWTVHARKEPLWKTGVAANASDSTRAPEGTQAAFLSGCASLSQAVRLPAGSYTVNVLAALGLRDRQQNLELTVDGKREGFFQPTSTEYDLFSRSERGSRRLHGLPRQCSDSSRSMMRFLSTVGKGGTPTRKVGRWRLRPFFHDAIDSRGSSANVDG